MFRLACVPNKLALLIIVLLPKPDGGNRPIGILATCIQIIARWCRWKFASRWELGNPRQYWFGESGKACDLCVWRQSMRAEYAVETGQSATSALLDLHKAYEYARHKDLLREASKHGFSLVVLRLAVIWYKMERVVVLQGIVTKQVKATQTIVAGCSWATT